MEKFKEAPTVPRLREGGRAPRRGVGSGEWSRRRGGRVGVRGAEGSPPAWPCAWWGVTGMEAGMDWEGSGDVAGLDWEGTRDAAGMNRGCSEDVLGRNWE